MARIWACCYFSYVLCVLMTVIETYQQQDSLYFIVNLKETDARCALFDLADLQSLFCLGFCNYSSRGLHQLCTILSYIIQLGCLLLCAFDLNITVSVGCLRLCLSIGCSLTDCRASYMAQTKLSSNVLSLLLSTPLPTPKLAAHVA